MKPEEPSTLDDAFFKRVTGLVLNELAEACRIRLTELPRCWGSSWMRSRP